MQVAGRALAPELPYGLRIETNGKDLQIVEPADRSFAGRLVLPFIDGRELRMFDLEVPSSGNFTSDDLEKLWEAGQELASWRSRLALTSPDDAYAQAEPIGRTGVLADWHALEMCASEAKRLLNGWPMRIGRELRWVPVGVGGGFEDLSHTEREVARVGYLSQHEAGIAVTRSARWFGRGERIALSAVSSLAREVTSLVETTLGEADRDALSGLTGPIDQVASLAAAPRHRTDPDPSSWPPAFARFIAACMRVLMQLLARQRGSQAVPLLDTDELFEAWLAVTVRDLIAEQYEVSAQISADSIASWQTDAMTIDLRVKPAVGRATAVGQEMFRALVASTLLPDVVVSATRGEFTEFAVLDAKAWAKILPEEVLSESAKYLYGIRRENTDQVPVITSVHIVSCAARPHMPSAADAKIGFVHATPTTGGHDLRAAVADVLTDLAAAIERREQEASLHS